MNISTQSRKEREGSQSFYEVWLNRLIQKMKILADVLNRSESLHTSLKNLTFANLCDLRHPSTYCEILTFMKSSTQSRKEREGSQSFYEVWLNRLIQKMKILADVLNRSEPLHTSLKNLTFANLCDLRHPSTYCEILTFMKSSTQSRKEREGSQSFYEVWLNRLIQKMKILADVLNRSESLHTSLKNLTFANLCDLRHPSTYCEILTFMKSSTQSRKEREGSQSFYEVWLNRLIQKMKILADVLNRSESLHTSLKNLTFAYLRVLCGFALKN